jgi:hypothetical protein
LIAGSYSGLIFNLLITKVVCRGYKIRRAG